MGDKITVEMKIELLIMVLLQSGVYALAYIQSKKRGTDYCKELKTMWTARRNITKTAKSMLQKQSAEQVC